MTQEPGRFRFEQEAGRVERLLRKIDALAITATTSGTAQTFYTVTADRYFELRNLIVCNTTAGALTLNLHEVPSGGAIGTANQLLNAYSVGANTTVNFAQETLLKDVIWEPEATIEVYASASGLTMFGDGWERY